ncbi:hypothetical protein [Methylocella sp.]|uniref:hypothetical protein n=1 Tax=Methylocella sp. TaxID=1978226 RepID=UPI003785140E
MASYDIGQDGERAAEAGARMIDAASDKADELKGRAGERLDELKSAAAEKFESLRDRARAGAAAAGETAGALAGRAGDVAEDAGAAVREVGGRAYAQASSSLARQPVVAVLAAAGVGYLIGYLAHARR